MYTKTNYQEVFSRAKINQKRKIRFILFEASLSRK